MPIVVDIVEYHKKIQKIVKEIHRLSHISEAIQKNITQRKKSIAEEMKLLEITDLELPNGARVSLLVDDDTTSDSIVILYP